MTWWFVLFAIVFLPFVWWAMWREDFDGMRTEAEMKRRTEHSIQPGLCQFKMNHWPTQLRFQTLSDI